MKLRSKSSILLSIALLAGLLGLLPPDGVALADTNPATSGLESRCDVERNVSTGSVAGLASAAPGETVRLKSVLVLDSGQVYQDIVGRPDGSVFYASVIELLPIAAGDVTMDMGSVSLEINGVTTALTPGTQPSTTGYVLDTSGGQIRVYFPGDAAAMLADVGGVGLPSVVVDSDNTEFVVSADVTVGTGPGVTAGQLLDLGTCRASISTGPSARTTGDKIARVGVAEPAISMSKTVNPLTVAAGSLATYTISVSNPESTPENPTGPAFDVNVVDTLPAEVVPVTSSGSPLGDGDLNASGLRWNAAAHTMTMSVPRVDPGTTTTLQIKVQLLASAAPASTFTNNVTASATSLPGSAAPERAYPPVLAQQCSTPLLRPQRSPRPLTEPPSF